ncbi:MAG: MBL fold metallo-hydrolase [Cytophagales bacterium]
MQLFSIHTGLFKLDGGAMFGVVPKSIWNKLNPSDENNLCTWAMRSLLVVCNDRKILIDTGIGNKQNIDFLKHFHLHGAYNLHDSLYDVGYSVDDITDVILTHLHFDHVGGAISLNESQEYIPTFPNAHYWIHSEQLNWALNPNSREKASFLNENILPLVKSKKLKFIDSQNDFDPAYIEFYFVDGHTHKQTLPLLKHPKQSILFCADLIPSVGHIPIPYVMSYDMHPLLTLKEKEELLALALKKNWLLFFEHDPLIEVCSLQETPIGVRMKETFKLNHIV